MIMWIFITIGGALGGWLGAAMDGGNMLGFWSIILGMVGSLVGVWAGYIIGKNYF